MPDTVCCEVNVHMGEGGKVIHADYHPKCGCGKRGQEVASLRYQRADGVLCMSAPICSHCVREEVCRLERLGFVLVYGVTTSYGRMFTW